MINAIEAIDKAKRKVLFYNEKHVKQWKSHVIINNILFIFWNKNKVEYIPFQAYGKTKIHKAVTKKEIIKKARIN